MKRLLAPLAAVLCLASSFAYAQEAAEAKDSPELKAALAFLQKTAAKNPVIKANSDTLAAIIERYYLDRDSLKNSELEIVNAFLEDFKIGARGSARESRLASAIGPVNDSAGWGASSNSGWGAAPSGKKPAAKPAPKKPVTNDWGPAPTTPKKPTAKPAPKPVAPKPAPKPVAPKPAAPKLAAMKKAPLFRSGERMAPGGKKIGFVELSIEGRKSTLVEVLSDSGMGFGKRAKVIESRFVSLHKADKLWWMNLRVAEKNGQAFVQNPRAPEGIVITADKAFAAECGLTPQALAKLLIRKIRDGMDVAAPGSIVSRSLETMEAEAREKALSLRQEGDALYGTDRAAALAKYESALDVDPTYQVLYLRIADVHLANKDKDSARAILEKGIAHEMMSEEGAKELTAKLKTISE